MYVKKIILITPLLCLPFFIYAQIINYQLVNGGFESWETITYNYQSITEPVQWNGFKTGVAPEGSLLAIAMSAMNIQFEACSDVRPGSTGIKSIKTWSLDLSWYRPNLVANGLFTTGQVHMSSASYSDPNNYYGTLLENSAFHQPFTAMPDSIYFWAKYKTTAATQNATVHIYIHDSSNTHDPVPTAMTSNVVASVLYEWPRGEQQWQQHKVAFNYGSWTNQNPAYILITFFTSPMWGVGTPYDTLYVDDIELIYNRLLSDLQVNGATLPAFNNQITNYSVPLCQPLTAENLPVITATAVSPHAVVTITQPTLQNPDAVITVTHGGSSKIYTVHFTGNSTSSVHNAQLCQGYPYNGYGFNIPNPATQQYSRTITGGNHIGCDSIIYLNLTVFPFYVGAQAITKYDTVCQGDNYNNYGFTLSPAETNTPGTITRTLNNLLTVNGCDSVAHLSLYVKPQNITQISDRVCQGTDYRQHGFNIPTATLQHTGTYNSTLHLANRFGCDSTVTLQLTVDSIFHTDLYDQICYGSNYVKHGFNLTDNHTAGLNTHEHILTSKQGCDSIVTLYLFVYPEYHPASLYVKLCGSSVYNFYGQILDTTGTYTHTLTSQYGCDNVITLILEKEPKFRTLLTASICNGDTYNQHGFSKSVSGFDSITHLATNGCDSMVVLDLTVFPSYTGAQAITKYDTVCQGDNYNNYGFTLSPAETDTPGTITRTLNNLLTANGCDSVAHLSLYVKPQNIIQISDRVCQGTDYRQHGFNIPAATLQHTGT
ncbi:MAG: PCMD domain-containing protein, partial [Bacteroidales bacterium]|nr:PCMD domain-containing protein [Bacteroidales bacterium]